MTEIFLGIVSFTGIVLLLSLFVLGARRLLVPSGMCSVTVNDRVSIEVPVGQRLLQALNKAEIDLPNACGGAGTCGLCKVRVIGSNGNPRPQELALLSRSEAARGMRLACQVPVLHGMNVEVDDTSFGVSTWQCTVKSITAVSSLISEIVLQLPAGEKLNFRPGSFVQVTCPPYQLDFSTMEISSKFKDVWDKSRLWALKAGSKKPVTKAYSMANRPDDQDVIRLNVRIALPPPRSRQIPPGVVSSWLFSRKPGDTVQVAGCFGIFLVKPSDKEAIFIGGGVGMAPLYAQIMDLFDHQNTDRKISFWYGARAKRELYYQEDFNRLQEQHDNFSWHVALSEPEPGDNWQGATGFIHKTIFDQYLSQHPAPEDCEYYLCGPPLMVKAINSMLYNLGVDADSIHYDDFGGG